MRPDARPRQRAHDRPRVRRALPRRKLSAYQAVLPDPAGLSRHRLRLRRRAAQLLRRVARGESRRAVSSLRLLECATDRRGSWAVMTDKGWKAIVKAAPDHVASVRNRLIDHLTVKDQEEVSKIFERIQSNLRSQYRSEESN